jgi:dimethylargininase
LAFQDPFAQSVCGMSFTGVISPVRPLLALTRPVPQSIVHCELTHLARAPIDFTRASQQHEEYENALRALGGTVEQLTGQPEQPDSVFIEDTAVVLDECAVITRPGAASRRGEVAPVAEALQRHRRLQHIDAPGTLDGGDVLLVGRNLFVGMSSRTNADGARQLADAVAAFSYSVQGVTVRDALHLKTAVTALPDERLILDPRKVDPSCFAGARWIEGIGGEATGTNVLAVNDTVICPADAPRTHALLEGEGYRVISVDASELAKAEGGLTCCSLLLRA